MAKFRGDKGAFGAPGSKPSWTQGNKEGVGTANTPASRLWFTISQGILNEIYHPTVDRPQTRDVQLLFLDRDGGLLEEKRDFTYEIGRVAPSQAYRLVKRDRAGKLSLEQEILSDPLRPCVLVHSRLKGEASVLESLKVYVLCAPHLQVSGAGNNSYVVEVCGREVLVAEKDGLWLAVDASCGLSRLSCGFAGASDGLTDLKAHGRMEHEFDQAKDGNVVLTGELALPRDREFTIAVGFGDNVGNAVSVVFQSLAVEFREQRRRFVEQWKAAAPPKSDLKGSSGDDGALFFGSYNMLLTHEDNRYQGALVASLTIPWGRRAATRTERAAITWSGRGTWLRAQWRCWRRAILKYRCEY